MPTQTTDDRLERLCVLVEDLPEGDKDREDLLLLFSELDRVEKLHRAALLRKVKTKRLREENRQLHGALLLAKVGLRVASTRVQEQSVTIGWLCRRLQRYGGKLADYEQQELKVIAKELST